MKTNYSKAFKKHLLSILNTSPRRLILVAIVPVLLVSLWLANSASAAIAYRSTASGNNAGGAQTLSINPPTGTAAGDVLIAIISVRGGTGTTITPPTGWNFINAQDSTTVIKSATYYRIATASESAYVFDFGTAQKASGVISAYTGVDNSTPIAANDVQVNGSVTGMTAPGVTTTEANTMVIAAYSTATGTTMTAGSSMNLRGQDASTGAGVGSRTTSGLQDIVQASAGTTGSKTMTAGTAAVNVGHTIALKTAPIYSQASYRFFQNSNTPVTNDDFKTINNPHPDPQLAANSVAWSEDGIYVATAINNYPYITISKRSGDTLTRLQTPALTPANTAYAVAWSADGVYLSVAHTASPYITIYKRSGDTFTKLANPATLPTALAESVAWSSDGTYMTVGHNSSPYITIYKRSGDTFTKLANPASLPTASVKGVAWSADTIYMTVATNVSPYITIYKRSGDTFTKLSDPASLPAGAAQGVSWSPDGVYVSVAIISSPYITIYKRSGDTFTKLSDPASLPAGTAYGVTWNSDGSYMAVAHGTSPYITIYKRSGDTFTKVADPNQLVSNQATGVDFQGDGTYLSLTSIGSPFLLTYKHTNNADVSTPLAAVNTAATPGVGVPFRLRLNLHVTNSSSQGDGFKLQYATKSGTCDTAYSGETFTDMSTFSGAIRFYDNSNLTDDMYAATNANDPTHSTDAIIRQTYAESNDLLSLNPIAVGEDGMWDFSLVVDSSAAYGSYCLRVVKSDGTVLSTPTQVPEVSNPAPTVTQANYRWFSNADSATPGSPLVAQDTAATVAAATPVRLRQRLAVDTASLASSGQSMKLQYAEKSGVCDTSFSGETYADLAPLSGPQSAYAGTAVNDSSVGSTPWNSPSIAVGTPDGGFSSISSPTSSGNTSSQYLKVTNFGFNIPSNATITSVKVIPTAYSDDAFNNYVSADRRQLVIGGTPTGTGAGSVLWTQSYPLEPVDLSPAAWGVSLSPSDVNSSSFGFALAAIAGYDTFNLRQTNAGVDAVNMSIYYTLPSGSMAYYDNATPADQATISSSGNDPTNSARPTVYQKYRETDPFTNNTAAIPSGSDGLWDFAITTTSGAAGKTYCLRAVKSDGSLLDTYSQIPELVISGGGGGATTDQKLRGGRTLIDGTKTPFEL